MRLVGLSLAVITWGYASGAQEAPANFESKQYSDIADVPLFAAWDGNFERGQVAIRAQSQAGNPITERMAREGGAFIRYEVVGDETALSVSINFSSFNLGKNSFIQVQGTEGEVPQVQWFDQETLEAWEGTTALFNGAYVDLYLFASADDPDAFYEISTIDIGRPSPERGSRTDSRQQDAVPEAEAICGADDRVRSADNRIGRIMPVGCSGWLESGGRVLTAGHCADGGRMRFLQFEVPDSGPDGTPNHPSIENQYRIVSDSVVFMNAGIGNDWAVFEVSPSFAQQDPHSRFGAFHLRRDVEKGNLWVRGYGLDDEPLGNPPSLRNRDSQTQQEHGGALIGIDMFSGENAVIRHRVDTRGGNSGSPIFLSDDPNIAIGIHSHGGCSESPTSFNHGTSFLNDTLWESINRR